MSFNKGLFSSKTPEWGTPQDLYDKLNERFHFDLDPACTTENCKCPKGFYADKGIDGLREKWFGNVYLNPPYGQIISHWINKAYYEHRHGNCKLVVALLPARTDTKYFHGYIYKKENVVFPKLNAI